MSGKIILGEREITTADMMLRAARVSDGNASGTY